MTDDDDKSPDADDEDHTPIPPPSPADRDSMEQLPSIVAEDRAAREAAQIPRPATGPTPTVPAKPDVEGGDVARESNARDAISTTPAQDPYAPRERPYFAPADIAAAAPSQAREQGEEEPTASVREPDVWDRIGTWLVSHGALPALALITLAIAIIHGRIFWGETAGDDLTFHFAESARLADCIAAGDWDFWNPSANGGYASLYYYQAIPQLASAIPAAIFGGHLFWFQLSVVLPLILAPAAAYKGMRLLGATPWQSLAAAFCVAFMNGESRWGSGSAGTFNVGLYTQTWSLCAFPLALGYAASWITEGKHLASAVAWSGFVFLCHPFGGISLSLAILMAWLASALLWGLADQLLRAIAPSLHGRGQVAELFARRWSEPPNRQINTELVRSVIFAALFAITMLPVALPLLVDADGFGGFPHRVNDEVGPGWDGLWKWYKTGALLDFMPKIDGKAQTRLDILTWAVPVVVLFARGRFHRWLWTPVVLYVVFLGKGPELGKLGDDLFPPVRFLGAMQTLAAMGIGAGVLIIGGYIWKLVEAKPQLTYVVRTALAAGLAALTVLVIVPGTKALVHRVRIFGDVDPKRDELVLVSKKLSELPQGRKQAGPGAESHWYNMLPYAWDRTPSTLQMGGGGLQASPNYDFLWTERDYVKNAWIFDAPYIVFVNSKAGTRVPNGVTIFKTANFEIRKMPSPGIVSPVTVVGVLPPGYRHKDAGHKEALKWAKGDGPMKDEVLAYAGFGGPGARAQGKTLRAWRQDSPGDDADIVAELEVQAPTTFVVRESWHPRWHAYLDGDEVPVRRVTPDFPAIDVPAGKHTLEMRFERPWWAHAAWLAWPLPPFAIWTFYRRRRRRIPKATALPPRKPEA